MLALAARTIAANLLRGAAKLLHRTANRFAVEPEEVPDWGEAFGRYELSPRAEEMLARRPAPPPPDEGPEPPLAGSAAARIAAMRGAGPW